mgnify:CR=1 FL=1
MIGYPAIRLEGVTKRFEVSKGGAVTALSEVNLTVEKGAFVSVVGPSGCGKSTILRLIAGLTSPSDGGVSMFETPVTEPRDEIGIVFQRPTLLPWLSIFDNVIFPIRHKRGIVGREHREEAEKLLEIVGLSDFRDRRPSELSGGMQQRAAIARALLLDPDVLLMDEPFSALDALTRDEMSIELLRIWTQRPKTVIFITHAISEAVLLSDRVAVMSPRPGRIARTVHIDLPRPRSLKTMGDPRFQELVQEIREAVLARPEEVA